MKIILVSAYDFPNLKTAGLKDCKYEPLHTYFKGFRSGFYISLISSKNLTWFDFFIILFFPSFNWDPLHARLNSKYKAWSYRKICTKRLKHTGNLFRKNLQFKVSVNSTLEAIQIISQKKAFCRQTISCLAVWGKQVFAKRLLLQLGISGWALVGFLATKAQLFWLFNLLKVVKQLTMVFTKLYSWPKKL